MTQEVNFRNKKSILEILRKGRMPYLCAGIYAALVLAMILVSVLVLKVAIVPVCVIAVLEAVLYVLLKKTPIYVHVILAIVQLAVGMKVGLIVLIAL